MPRFTPVLVIASSLLLVIGCEENNTPVAPETTTTPATTSADASANLPDVSDVPDQAEHVQPLAVGESAPAVQLRSADGDPVDLDEVYTNGPTMLVIYRGGWCPYCNTQLGHLSKAHASLQAMGYKVYGISPDRPEKLRETRDEIPMDYNLLSDAEMVFARAMGLAFRVNDETLASYHEYGIDLEDASGQSHQLLPVPAVVLIDTDGVIRYVDYNPDYTVRLEPEALIAAAQSVQGE